VNIDNFFKLLSNEIEQNENLDEYYRFNSNKLFFEMKKNYFCQRLKYIENNLNNFKNKNNLKKENIKVLDCGCGYGSAGIFLAINGYEVNGLTIGEHYINGIQKRKDYWKKYGDPSKFNAIYEYLPDLKINNHYDIIILQDTLHHLEPLDDCIKALHNLLKPDGILIITEANGANPFHILKQYIRRGNKRINEVYDKILCKKIVYGDENFKSLNGWKQKFAQNNFIVEKKIEYVKIIPFVFKGFLTFTRVIEKTIAICTPVLREYIFGGINFTVIKSS